MRLDRGAFRLDNSEVSLGEVLAASLGGGSLAPLLQAISERHAAADAAREQGIEIDPDALQEAFDTWRQDRDLIAAEELERWLEHHELEVDDIAGYLENRLLHRRLGRRRGMDFAATLGDADLLGISAKEALLSGRLSRLVEDFALRACAPDPALGDDTRMEAARRWMLAEAGFPVEETYYDAVEIFGVQPARARWLLDRELAYRMHEQDVLTQEALRQGLAELRDELRQYEISTATFRDEDVAREAACCVKEDRDSFSHAAARAGESATSATWFHGELADAPFGDRMGSAREREVVGPLVLPDGRASLGQLRSSRDPDLGDQAVLERVEKRLVERSLRRALQQRVLFPPSLLGSPS